MPQTKPLRTRRLCAAIAAALGGLLCAPAAQATAVLPLSSLDGSNGFRIDGVAADDLSGLSVSAAGDINGDGIDDLIIGASGADPNGSASGSSYVVFGRSPGDFASAIDLSSLDGNNGFRLDGVASYDFSGRAVSGAGDINGDGFDDLLIGAYGAGPNGSFSGSSYVVFGGNNGFDPDINLETLDGGTGFRLDGVAAGDYSGFAVSAVGDINADGIDDLVIGAPLADPNGISSGSSYVVFGSSNGFASVINLSTLSGSNGFRIDGGAANDFSGGVVSAAGDINGDGIDDLIIGAIGADPNGINSGSSYVIFGDSSDSFASAIDLSSLTGSNGFRLDGVAAYDRSGRAVSAAGDINGDGIDDLIIGAVFADPNGSNSGASYVVFGRSIGFDAALDLSSLDGSNGFRLDGVAAEDRSGIAVSAAGDINGDGIDDLIVGAYGADSSGSDSGSSYLVFGRSTGAFAAVINLSSLDGGNGFRLDGVAAGDQSGRSVSAAGDINGDGIDDLIIGADGADPNGSNSGSSYVVFGKGIAIFCDGFEAAGCP